MTAPPPAVPQNYGVHRWGEGYFGINALGHLSVWPRGDLDHDLDLFELAGKLGEQQLSLPVLVRFTDILRHRVQRLCASFAAAADEQGYAGRYTAVYPIKVNQQRVVVEEILRGDQGVGLEAGSKPELMAVLALSRPAGTIVCNGYKDREYIRTALIGQALGHRVYIVIEKPSELALVREASSALGMEPLLGVRVRLAASAAGNWQNSGGERAKFGLGASQVLELVKNLRDHGQLRWLRLLHSHTGSQIPNLRDIRRGLAETARYFAELRRLGVPLETVDVGGGLGIDYEGTGTRSFCSTNYNLESYAREVIKAFARVCSEHELPHPHIITESGRALTAHHAVLITRVIDRDPPPQPLDPLTTGPETPEVIASLNGELQGVHAIAPQEAYEETRQLLLEARELFQAGNLALEHWALAEQLWFSVCHRLCPRLNAGKRRDRELLDRINEQLAEKVFLNFSLFQSVPDVWALDQSFPVAPLQRLNEAPTGSATLQDLTCDSDGCFGHYVDQDGIDNYLPIHPPQPGEPYLVGIFLVGAYQEILGDMHNLFGDTDAVNVEMTDTGQHRFTQPEKGDRVDELLSYVHFSPEEMLAGYRRKLNSVGLPEEQANSFYNELEAGLSGYTYLED